MEFWVQYIPIILMSIPFAFGSFYLAKRLNKNPKLWVVLSLIPIVNFWLFIRISYLIIFKRLDVPKRIQPEKKMNFTEYVRFYLTYLTTGGVLGLSDRALKFAFIIPVIGGVVAFIVMVIAGIFIECGDGRC